MSRYTVVLGFLMLAGPAAAHGQARWKVDAKSSLAWWQMSPNLNHLWGTTCPGDSSWRPGEGRSSGWYINPKLKLPKYGYANIDDTVNVPLFPRTRVYPSCIEAVRGEVVAPDTVHWRGTLGTVMVKGENFVTGESMRDLLMHQVMQTAQFPDIVFSLDSLSDLTLQGDTLHGKAIGVLTFRDQKKPTVAVVKAFRDAGGMRVLAKWRVPAHDLLEMTPKLHYLGLGVNTNIWHDFFMGADIVFRPAPVTPEGRGGN
jgi:polyisoprenoid-binding protein YceI